MSDDPVESSVEDARLYALRETTRMWREAQRLANDSQLSQKTRTFYEQKAREFHEQMVSLGHKHE